jgi:hypothetical protein
VYAKSLLVGALVHVKFLLFLHAATDDNTSDNNQHSSIAAAQHLYTSSMMGQ